MAQFVDRPLPASLELPRIAPPKPRDKRLDNLRYGPGIGRPKGVQDKITRDLKLGVIEGAVQTGFDGEGQDGLVGYCRWLARYHPKAYCGLLGKMLPMNLNTNTPGPSISSISILSVPSGVHLSPEQLALAEQGKPFTIDHDQMREEPAPEPEPIEVRSPEEAKLLAELKAMSADELLARLSNALVPER